MSGVWAAVGAVWNWVAFAAILVGGVYGLALLKQHNARAAQARADTASDDELEDLGQEKEP